ncbi:MAG: hypothetical protein JSS81_11615 [Acidobacteria bacterium]|nr:hypothetical protein [Acidobacteriota bacterium]
MTIRRSTFNLVPRKEVFALFNAVPGFMDAEWFAEKDWFRDQAAADYEKAFDALLPRAAGGGHRWSDDAGNAIEMRVENEKPAALAVQLGADPLKTDFAAAVVEFAAANELLFRSMETGGFVEPVWDKFLEKFRLGRALLFARDPAANSGDRPYYDAVRRELEDGL